MLTAVDRAVEACTRRRKVCVPGLERSRSSRRRRGVRGGRTPGGEVTAGWEEDGLLEVAVVSEGGSAEECGAGGLEGVVVLVVMGADMT